MVSQELKGYFFSYSDQRSYTEKILNSIQLTSKDLGRSFALIAGVSEYPGMPWSERKLEPAAEDLRKLKEYLRDVEFFDEIVLLTNENMNYKNLSFFLQVYFPGRLKKFPKSRFLFAYSGHGITEGSRGYLLLSSAKSLSDKQHSINMRVVRALFDEVVDAGHHVLALINACYSGTFINRKFGSLRFLPKHRGAHAITAGATGEPTWHDPNVGTGSIFFEKFFEGLNGYADGFPRGGDGLVTVDELAAYLKQSVQISTDQHQNPQAGDLLKGGSTGGFFFLNRHRQVANGFMPPWTPESGTSHGESSPRVRTIDRLLAKGDAYFKRKRYTTPPGANAFETYREVLKLDPTSEHAHRQIEKIAAFYKSLAEKYEKSGEKGQAIWYYRKYLEIEPDEVLVLKKITALQSSESTIVPAKQLSLRSRPRSIASVDAKKTFKLDENWHPIEQINNDYEDRGEVVFDRATGLLWQKSGSGNSLTFSRAQKYVQQLNRSRFAGYADWRLPTIPELISLMEAQIQSNGLYIDPIFDDRQSWCWSSDKDSYYAVWYVNFDNRYVRWYHLSSFSTGGAASSWARAVRSATSSMSHR